MGWRGLGSGPLGVCIFIYIYIASSQSRLNETLSGMVKPKKIVRHGVGDIGYTVDVADLLFTPNRDFLITNNGEVVRVGDLKGKIIVLLIVPIYEYYLKPGDHLDMLQAYHELLLFKNVEFVFVPVYIDHITKRQDARPLKNPLFASQEAVFNHLFSKMPWPAVPFSDIVACGDRVVETFSVDDPDLGWVTLPYWVIIDPARTVAATRAVCPHLFKLFGGAELWPLSFNRIYGLMEEFDFLPKTRKRLITNWDQLLVSPGRDFLLSSTGDKVPVSSLKGRVIGLYFCENVRCPPHMTKIKKVYEEAKRRGHDFEIVQINCHYEFFNTMYEWAPDMSVQQCRENISWLTLPFKDPSCRKLQRIFNCIDMEDYWQGACLVIVNERQADQVLFEFSGAEIIHRYGIEGYPFTRQSLVKKEYTRQRKELKLHLLFPPGKCLLRRPAGGDLLDASQLYGKRVIVVFPSNIPQYKSSEFLSMLKSKYLEDENEFEVVYLSTDGTEALFTESVKGMPWLVQHNYDIKFAEDCSRKILDGCGGIGVAAFDTEGELIARESYWKKEHHKPEFPFISQDLEGQVTKEVNHLCELDRYYISDSDSDSE